MIFVERTLTLKDGRTCTLRPTAPDDAADMIDYLKQTAAETPFLLRNPDEVTYTLEAEQEILGRLLADNRAVMMLALVDGEVAGNCSLTGLGDKRRLLHRSSLAIALKKAYWGLGIGTAMIGYLSELAEQIGYEQIELEVVAGNEQALRLYSKCGFTQTGRHLRALKYDDGSYRDELIMSKLLAEREKP